jgi:hypothetical protein
MNEVTLHDDSNSLLAVIARAAADPTIDLDKMDRLLAMQEKLFDRGAQTAFNVSFSEAQSMMRPIAADASNPQTRSRYATYARLDGALRPIYTSCGFAISFDTGDSPLPDHVRVLGYLTHSKGHSKAYHVDMPADGKGAKGGDVMTKTHAMGAGMSYGMRYLLRMIWNVAVGEDDNDGNDINDLFRLNEWILQVQEAKDRPEVESLWLTGLAAMKKANAIHHREALQAACKARTDAFRTAEAT